MPNIATGTITPGNSITTPTADKRGITVGVKGKKFRIHFKLGGTNVYQFGIGNEQDSLTLDAASEVTILNLGDTNISFDIYVPEA